MLAEVNREQFLLGAGFPGGKSTVFQIGELLVTKTINLQWVKYDLVWENIQHFVCYQPVITKLCLLDSSMKHGYKKSWFRIITENGCKNMQPTEIWKIWFLKHNMPAEASQKMYV